MKSLRKSSSQSNRFGLDQFYQDLNRVQSSLGKKYTKNIQSPMRPERQKKIFNVNIDKFYKNKEPNLTLQKKNTEKVKLNLINKNQHKMKSLNISELNTDVQAYDRNYRQSEMPSYQMQESLEMTNQYTNLNDYHNASLKYSENNFSNRDLENLLSDDRLSQSSQKNYKNSKHFIKHFKQKQNQVRQQKEFCKKTQEVFQSHQANNNLIQQMRKRAYIYDYVCEKQNCEEQSLKQKLKQKIAKHQIMTKIIEQFKKLSNLQKVQSSQELLNFLKKNNFQR